MLHMPSIQYLTAVGGRSGGYAGATVGDCGDGTRGSGRSCAIHSDQASCRTKTNEATVRTRSSLWWLIAFQYLCLITAVLIAAFTIDFAKPK